MLELVKGGNLLLNGNSCSTQLMASLFTNSKGYIAQNKYYLIYKLSPLVQHLYVKILLVIDIMVKTANGFPISKLRRILGLRLSSTSAKVLHSMNPCGFKSAPQNKKKWENHCIGKII